MAFCGLSFFNWTKTTLLLSLLWINLSTGRECLIVFNCRIHIQLLKNNWTMKLTAVFVIVLVSVVAVFSCEIKENISKRSSLISRNPFSAENPLLRQWVQFLHQSQLNDDPNRSLCRSLLWSHKNGSGPNAVRIDRWTGWQKQTLSSDSGRLFKTVPRMLCEVDL